MRLGNAAFGQKDYDAAVNFFEAAEARTADPGLVAFNKAAALYRLGRYAEAERHYRMCLEDAEGPRKAQASMVAATVWSACLKVAMPGPCKKLSLATTSA